MKKIILVLSASLILMGAGLFAYADTPYVPLSYAVPRSTFTIFNGKQLNINSGNLWVSSGNTGLGTQAPAGMLHVNATFPFLINAKGNVGIGTTAPAGIVHVSTGAGMTNFFISATSGNTGIGTTAPAGLFHINSTYPFIIKANGNVGIGLTNPLGLLHVSTGAGTANLFVSALTGNVGIGTTNPLYSLDLSHLKMSFSEGYNIDALYFTSGSTVTSMSGTTNYIPKWTSPTAQGNSVVTDVSGYVGISTYAPAGKFSIQQSGTGMFDGLCLFNVAGSTEGIKIYSNTGYGELTANNFHFNILDSGSRLTLTNKLVWNGSSGVEIAGGLYVDGEIENHQNNLITVGADGSFPFSFVYSPQQLAFMLGLGEPAYVAGSGFADLYYFTVSTSGAVGMGVPLNAGSNNTLDLISAKFMVLGEGSTFFIKTDGNVGIGTVNPTSLLTVDSISNTGKKVLSVKGFSQGGLYSLDNGNIGVGTTAPASMLDVVSGIKISSTTEAPANGLFVYNSTDNDFYGYKAGTWTSFTKLTSIPSNTIYGTGTLSYIPKFDSSGSIVNSNIFNKADGNIGIGTVMPSFGLDVQNANGVFLSTGGTGVIHNAVTISPNGNVGIGITNPVQYVNIRSSVNAVMEVRLTNDCPDSGARSRLSFWGHGGTTTLGSLQSGTGGGADFYVASNNRSLYVQAGGSADTRDLHLTAIASTAGMVNLYAGATTGLVRITNSANNRTYFQCKMVDGNIGIGTTAPAGILHVSTGTALNAFFIQNVSGNVGVGTSAPVETLNVNGGIKIASSTFAPAEGAIVYNSTDKDFYGFNDTKWKSLTATGGSSAGITGTGTSSWVPVWNSTGSLTDSPIQYDMGASVSNQHLNICNAGVVYIGNYSDMAGGYLHIGTSGTPSGFTTSGYESQLYMYRGDNIGQAWVNFVSTSSNVWAMGLSSTDSPDDELLFNSDIVSNVLTMNRNGNVGIGTSAPVSNFHCAGKATVAKLHLNNDGMIISSGTFGGGALSPDFENGADPEQNNTTFLWYPRKASLRAGHTTASGQFNEANIGSCSVGFGDMAMSSGAYSAVLGGNGGVAGGYGSTVVGGVNNHASGQYSLAAGRSAFADLDGSFAFQDSISGDFHVDKADTFGMNFTNGYWLLGGNAGIGTSAPAEKLEVNGNVKVASMSFTNDNVVLNATATYSSNSGLLAGQTGSYYKPSNMITGTGTSSYIPLWNSTGSLTDSPIQYDMGAGVSNQHLNICNAGVVYIGNYSDMAGGYLHIGTSGTPSGFTTSGGYESQLYMYRGDNTGQAWVNFVSTSSNVWAMGLSSTDSPDDRLLFNSDITNYVLTMNRNGNIGMGTSNPTTALEVTGDIFISSRPCGELTWLNNLSSITVITAGETFELVAGTSSLSTQSAWFGTTTDAYGNQNRLTYTGAKTHKFLVEASGCMQDATTDTSTGRLTIYKTGTATGRVSSSYFPVLENFRVHTIISLATNDYLEVWVTTDNGNEVNVYQMTLTAVPID